MRHLTEITDGIDGSRIDIYLTADERGFPILKGVYEGQDRQRPLFKPACAVGRPEEAGAELTYQHLTAAVIRLGQEKC